MTTATETKPAAAATDTSWLTEGLDEATKLLIADENTPAAAPPAEPATKTPDTATPAAAAPAPEPVVVEDPKPPAEDAASKQEAYIKQLHADQKAKDDIIQKLLADQQALLAKTLAPAQAPNPEEAEAKAEQERQLLQADPDGYLKKREAELLKKATEDAAAQSKAELATQMGFKSVDHMDSHFASVQGVQNLETQKEAYPLMADVEFRKALGDQANLQETAKLYPKGVPASAILKDPLFWHSAYQRAALAHLAKPKTETATASAEPPLAPSLSASPPTTVTKPAAGAQLSAAEQAWAAVMDVKVGAF